MEHKGLEPFLLQPLLHSIHARRSHPKHSQTHRTSPTRPAIAIGRQASPHHHPSKRRGGIREQRPAHTVQPGNVHHRREQDQIGGADIRLGPAAGDGGDDEFGDPNRKRPERRRSEGRPPAAADADGTAQAAVVERPLDESRQCGGHERDSFASVVGEAIGGGQKVASCDEWEVAAECLGCAGADGDVDDGDLWREEMVLAVEVGSEGGGEEAELVGFGVGGSDAEDRLLLRIRH